MPHSLRHEPNNDHRRAAGDVAALLPAPDWRRGRNDRLFVEAMCWILGNGAAWRNLPPRIWPLSPDSPRPLRKADLAWPLWKKFWRLKKDLVFAETFDQFSHRKNQWSYRRNRGWPKRQAIGRSRGALMEKFHLKIDA
jgi:hypothetical protein